MISGADGGTGIRPGHADDLPRRPLRLQFRYCGSHWQGDVRRPGAGPACVMRPHAEPVSPVRVQGVQPVGACRAIARHSAPISRHVRKAARRRAPPIVVDAVHHVVAVNAAAAVGPGQHRGGRLDAQAIAVDGKAVRRRRRRAAGNAPPHVAVGSIRPSGRRRHRLGEVPRPPGVRDQAERRARGHVLAKGLAVARHRRRAGRVRKRSRRDQPLHRVPFRAAVVAPDLRVRRVAPQAANDDLNGRADGLPFFGSRGSLPDPDVDGLALHEGRFAFAVLNPRLLGTAPMVVVINLLGHDGHAGPRLALGRSVMDAHAVRKVTDGRARIGALDPCAEHVDEKERMPPIRASVYRYIGSRNIPREGDHPFVGCRFADVDVHDSALRAAGQDAHHQDQRSAPAQKGIRTACISRRTNPCKHLPASHGTLLQAHRSLVSEAHQWQMNCRESVETGCSPPKAALRNGEVPRLGAWAEESLRLVRRPLARAAGRRPRMAALKALFVSLFSFTCANAFWQLSKAD